MLESYCEELKKLHELALEFAKKYPEHARMLGLEGANMRDPYIERLLEGIAFLTANLHARLDDGLPEIAENLLRTHFPQALMKRPSLSIVQLMALENQRIREFKRGSIIAVKLAQAQQKDLTTYFRTVENCFVYPLKIQKIKLEQQNKYEFNLSFELLADAHDIIINDLPIYIKAQDSALWYMLLGKYVKNIQVYDINAQEIKTQVTIGVKARDYQDNIFFNSAKGFLGYVLLQEYLHFQEAFYYINLKFDNLLIKAHSRVKIFLIVEHNLNILFSQSDICKLYLNTVLIANSWEQRSEPILVNKKKYEYTVIAEHNTEELIIQDILSANARLSDGTVANYALAYEGNFIDPASFNGRFFTVRENRYGDLSNYKVAFFGGDICNTEVVTLNLQVMHGNIPHELLREEEFIGTVMEDRKYHAHTITRPTLMAPCVIKHVTSLLLHLNLKIHAIDSSDMLKNILTLYNWQHDVMQQRKIDAIQELKLISYNKFYCGVLVKIFKFTLLIDKNKFSSIGDIYLFGQVLQRFFLTLVEINTGVELLIHLSTTYAMHFPIIW